MRKRRNEGSVLTLFLGKTEEYLLRKTQSGGLVRDCCLSHYLDYSENPGYMVYFIRQPR